VGTSTSHKSPDTTNWHAAQAAYLDERIPVQRAVQEIWRAAMNQPHGDLSDQLSAPIIALCLHTVSSVPDQREALGKLSREIALSGSVSLATDIARRAAAQAFASQEGRSNAFVASLFREATDYLVARDLPGFVGPRKRAKSASEAIALKAQLKAAAADIARRVPPPGSSPTPTAWRRFVASVVAQLSGRHREVE
jgi:hypothetical protein